MWPVIYGLIIGFITSYSDISPQSTIDITAYIPFWLMILSFTPLMFTQGVIFILNQMVSDKETKMRETLKIMGLSRTAYGTSYLLMQGLITLLSAVILWLAIVLPIQFSGNDFNYLTIIASTRGKCSVLPLFFAILLFGLNINGFAQVISTLFSDSKLAS